MGKSHLWKWQFVELPQAGCMIRLRNRPCAIWSPHASARSRARLGDPPPLAGGTSLAEADHAHSGGQVRCAQGAGARGGTMPLNGATGVSGRPTARRRRGAAPPPPPPPDRVDERVLLSVLTSFKKGNFSARLPVEWTGVAGRISDTLNDVLEINEKMARELERLSRVVGKEGKLNQRANLGEFSGAWAASIGCVNSLIDDLVYPDSEMARVIGAVAKGDLSQSMSLEADGHPLQGEFLRTAKTVNRMVD